jgi:hypothetical protein
MIGELEVMQEDDGADDKLLYEQYFDERTGCELDPKLALKAKREEITFMKSLGLFDETDEVECWLRTGKAPISTRWVVINKGTAECPDIRCRLVARDFKPKGDNQRGDLFAAMPPLEAKKMLFRMAIGMKRTLRQRKWQKMKLLFIDVKKAHLNGVVPEDEMTYVELPPEAGVSKGKCGRLRRWLYGMRQAASAWEPHYAEKLESVGFIRGVSAATVFFNPIILVRCVVHGDDFTFAGFQYELVLIEAQMKSWYALKVRATLGGERGDDEEITILNRRLTWKGDVMTYEANPKHASLICEEAELTPDSKVWL